MPSLNERRLRAEFIALSASNRRAMKSVKRDLSALSKSGVLKGQFEVFRVNYCFRSVTTVSSVAATVAAALTAEPARIELAKRVTYGALLEELGAPLRPSRAVQWLGEFGPSHPELLAQCLDIFGEHAFGLPAFAIEDVEQYPAVKKFAQRYRRKQTALFSPGDLIRVLSAAFAQEMAADGMLRTIQDGLFKPLFSRVPWPLLQQAMQYFDVHLSEKLGEVELQHGNEAWENLFSELQRSPGKVSESLATAAKSFELQSNFFLSLVDAMKRTTA